MANLENPLIAVNSLEAVKSINRNTIAINQETEAQGNQIDILSSVMHLGGAIRNNGSGWSLIEDSAHNNINFTGISTSGYQIILTFDEVDLISDFLVTPDETFASYGLVAGASVTKTAATIDLFMPCRLYFSLDGLTITGKNLSVWQNDITVVSNDVAKTLTITHNGFKGDMPVLSPLGSSSNFTDLKNYSYAPTSTTITIRFNDITFPNKFVGVDFGMCKVNPNSLIANFGNLWISGTMIKYIGA